MDRQWNPYSNLPPSSSPPPNNGLEDRFSQLSLSNSEFASQFPNLPRANNIDPGYRSLSEFITLELDKHRSYVLASGHEVSPNFPGSSSYSSYPNLINNTPGLGLGLGDGLVLGSGSGFVTPSEYSSMMLPRNGFRSSGIGGGDDDLEYRLRLIDPHYTNNIINNNLIINDYEEYIVRKVLKSLLSDTMNDYDYNNKNNHQVNHHNHKNKHSKRSTTTTSARNRVSNSSNSVSTPSSVGYFPPSISWEQIRGKVAEYAVVKASSDCMIRKFELGHMDGVKMVVAEVKQSIKQILLNPNGTNFFQRLLDFLDKSDILELLKGVMASKQDLIEISNDNHGTRSAQRLMACLDTNCEEAMLLVRDTVEGVVQTLTTNMNGQHFFKTILGNLKGGYEVIEPILQEVANNCVRIGMDRSGCCALQTCIQYGEGSGRFRIINEIVTHAVELSQDKYGNYVVQYLIGTENIKDYPLLTSKVVMALKGYLWQLSKDEFGSYVVEKCLRAADDRHAYLIIKEIFVEDNSVFLDFLQDSTANFVAQTALDRAKDMHFRHGYRPSLYLRLVERIAANYPSLHIHVHGRRMLSHVKFNKFRYI